MKKILALLVLLGLVMTNTGCGARRRGASQANEATAVAATVQASNQQANVQAPALPQAQPTPADLEASLPENSRVLFRDDFQDGEPDGWKTSGAWFVNQDGDAYTFGASGSGSAYISSGGSWGDYIYRATVNLAGGTFSMVFRWGNTSRYVLFFASDGLTLNKVVGNGEPQLLASAPAPALDSWHGVAIGCQGGHIQVYVDRILVIDYTDSDPLPGGTAGVGSQDGSQVAVDDVLVATLAGTLPEASASLLSAAPVEEGQESPPPPPEAEQPNAPQVGDDNAQTADLEITNVSISPNNPVAGQWMQVGVTIANHGPGVASNFQWGVIPTYDDGGPNNPQSGETIAVLNPGDDLTSQTQVIYPSAGTYTLRAIPDLLGVVNDPTPDSFRDVQVVVSASANEGSGKPDLYGMISFSDSNPQAGETISVQVEAGNAGSAAAGAFTIRWLPYSDTQVGCSWDFQGVGAGEIVSASPCNFTYPQAGAFSWMLVVDAEGEVSESTEDNNDFGGEITVGSGGAQGGQALPDLVVTLGDESSTEGVVGQTIHMVFKIRNQGNAPAGAFTVEWAPYTNNIVGCSKDIASLGIGATKSITCNYAYDHSGGFGWSVTVDIGEEIDESNETNNQLQGMMPIHSAGGN